MMYIFMFAVEVFDNITACRRCSCYDKIFIGKVFNNSLTSGSADTVSPTDTE